MLTIVSEILSQRTDIPVDKLSLAIVYSPPIYESDLKYMSDTVEIKAVTTKSATSTALTSSVSNRGVADSFNGNIISGQSRSATGPPDQTVPMVCNLSCKE